MKRLGLITALLFLLPLTVPARDWKVRNVESLRRAVEKARPGDRILLRPGTYRLSEPLRIEGKQDLLIAPLREGRPAVINGGVRIPRHCLKKGKGLAKDVRCLDISRWPVTDILQKGHGHASGPAWSEFFADGRPMHLSVWPEGEWMPLDSVVAEGISVRFGRGGAAHPDRPLDVKPSADVSLARDGAEAGSFQPQTTFGVIAFRPDRPLTWKKPELGWLSGCFRYGWADETVGILAIRENHTLEVRDTTYYGFGFKPGERFQKWRILNIPEEVDQPGEYALDVPDGKAVLCLPERCRVLELSLLGEPLIEIGHCKGVRISGLELACSRGDGIAVSASEAVSVEGCRIRNLGHMAVCIAADCRQCGVRDCEMSDLGAGGVLLNGGDRVHIVRGDNFVEDCVLHDYNRIEKSNRPAVILRGLGNRISRCEIYNSSNQAIFLYGNDQLIEDCDIHDVCLDVEDNGAIYNGRNPSERGNVIRRNYFHDIQVPWNVRAVYHDDGACACEVYGNIFNRISSPPVQIGGGSDIVYHDNIFMNLDCAAIKIDGRLKTWGADRRNAHKTYVAEVDGPAFRAHYPDFAPYWEGDPAEPNGNILVRNVFYNVRWVCEKVVWSDHQYNDTLEGSANFFSEMHDNWKTTDNPGFKDPENPRAGFVPDPPLQKHIPDFRLHP